MNRRLLAFFLAAAVPLVILTLLFPERIFRGTPPPLTEYVSVEGADIAAFISNSCPHCAAFEAFARSKNWDVEYFEITAAESQEKFAELQERAPDLNQGVPTIVVDGRIIQGYGDDETTGVKITSYVEACRASAEGCLPFAEFLASDRTVEVETAEGVCTEGCTANLDKYVYDLPVIGTVDLTLLSLPVLSILLGFLDGFNPCAMWVLITLLTLLIATRDPRKVWIVGGTFLLVSGAMYYLFIAAWLNAFLLIGFNAWVQKVIGLVALGGGAFYFYEALGKDPNACQVTDYSQKKKITDRMKAILEKSAWPAMILGVSILAASVNMIELVCTAGLPAVFTSILAFNGVSPIARYLYMGLYILLYMIDDVVIFAIAVWTLHATGLTKKYARFTLIFGGALMYALGLLLIFAPEVLTFTGS